MAADGGNFSFVAPRLGVLGASFCRFPLASLAALAFAAITTLSINDVAPWASNEIWSFICICAFFSMVAIGLVGEARSWGTLKTYAASVLALALLAGWTYLVGTEIGLPHWMLGCALFISCVIAPALGGANNEEFWYFNQQTFLGFGIAILATLLFCLGISAISYAISELFGSIGNWMRVALVIASSVFCPIYTITFIPRLPHKLDCAPLMPGALAFVLSYIALPVLLIYGAVIAVYGVQVMGLGRPPATSVSWMVMGFAAAAIALHTLLYPLRLQGNGLVRFFEKRVFIMLLPLLGLLFWALSLRVHDYGITENRYLAILGGFWATMIAVFVVIRQGEVRLGNAPAALALLLLIASIGPWGAEGLSYQNQKDRFVSMLEDIGLIKNGQLLEPTERLDVSWQTRRDISSLLDYFKSRRDGRIPPYLDKYGDIDLEEVDNWSAAIMRRWQMRYVSRWDDRGGRDASQKERRFTYSADDSFMQQRTPLVLDGYSVLLPFQEYAYNFGYQRKWEEYGVSLKLQGDTLQLIYKDASHTLPLIPLLGVSIEDESEYTNGPTVSQEMDLAGGKLRIMFDRLEFEKVEDQWRANAVTGYILFRP